MFRVRGNKLDVQHGDDCGHEVTYVTFRGYTVMRVTIFPDPPNAKGTM